MAPSPTQPHRRDPAPYSVRRPQPAAGLVLPRGRRPVCHALCAPRTLFPPMAHHLRTNPLQLLGQRRKKGGTKGKGGPRPTPGTHPNFVKVATALTASKVLQWPRTKKVSCSKGFSESEIFFGRTPNSTLRSTLGWLKYHKIPEIALFHRTHPYFFLGTF